MALLRARVRAAPPAPLAPALSASARFDGARLSVQARAAGTGALRLEVCGAPWIERRAAPVDGRYIAYLSDAAAPGQPGIPVAQFSIQGGRIVAAQPVPLPLTELR